MTTTTNPETTVFVLVVEHKHGRNISVHRSIPGATAALVTYCEEWWNDLGRAELPPEDSDELIQTYFEAIEDESYEIAPTQIED